MPQISHKSIISMWVSSDMRGTKCLFHSQYSVWHTKVVHKQCHT